MRFSFIIILIIGACNSQNKHEGKLFPVLTVTEDEWATYEGSWLAPDGVIRFELSLKSGAVGYDSYYKLSENFEADSMASGTSSYGLYSTIYDQANKEVQIRLHDLSEYNKGFYLRHKNNEGSDEMFFRSRGNNELLPGDENFNPVTEDERYTLHKRSKLFTVEGYVSFEQDSAEFYERNTMERWKVANLGEFNKLRKGYLDRVKVNYEGVYVKALAYSVLNSSSSEFLVMKRVVGVGNDPD